MDKFVQEMYAAALERTIKRLWILAIILILALIGTNLGWLYYENQFEDLTTVTQDVSAEADGDSDINLHTIGGDYNGSESDGETDSN
jgi:hypothetical protein